MHPHTFLVTMITIGSGMLWHQTDWMIGASSFSIGFWALALFRESED